MYEISIMLQNGDMVEGYISEYGFNNISHLIKKKRFWRNKVLNFELFELSEDNKWEYNCTVVLRNKEVAVFTYKFLKETPN